MQLFKSVSLSTALSLVTAGGAWLTGADPNKALPGLPGEQGWRAAVSAVAPGVPAPDPDSATPEQVRRFFAGLTASQGQALSRRAPGVVGNLDGAPPSLRYETNERTAGRRLEGRLLEYDPRGDGRITEVFGDLATARQIAVLVPGSGWDMSKIIDSHGRRNANPVAGAAALRTEMRRLSPGASTAVVVWLGYDAPEGVDRQAARSERAEPGARALARFLSGLPGEARVSLIGHSYGSVVCGLALKRYGARAHDVVALASPGMDTESAADLQVPVWAARVTDDPVEFTPHLRMVGYGHQADPTSHGFGARVLQTGTARGHGGYYTTGTELFANLARIAVGRGAEVTLAKDR